MRVQGKKKRKRGRIGGREGNKDGKVVGRQEEENRGKWNGGGKEGRKNIPSNHRRCVCKRLNELILRSPMAFEIL